MIADVIKDSECYQSMPVLHGVKDKPIYENGIEITPRVPGKSKTDYMKAVFERRIARFVAVYTR